MCDQDATSGFQADFGRRYDIPEVAVKVQRIWRSDSAHRFKLHNSKSGQTSSGRGLTLAVQFATFES